MNDWQLVQFGPFNIPEAVFSLPSFTFGAVFNITNELGSSLNLAFCRAHLNLSNYHEEANLVSSIGHSGSIENGASINDITTRLVTIDDYKYQSEGDLVNTISFDVALSAIFPSGTIGELSSGSYSHAGSVKSTFTAGDFMEGDTRTIYGTIYPDASNLILNSSGSNDILVTLNINLHK